VAETTRGRMTASRKAGLALAGLLGAGLAVASGTAFASSSSPAASMSMAGMSSGSSHPSAVGNTKGWFHGSTVVFHYTKEYSCANPPSSQASSNCEAGAKFTKPPAKSYDPLYVIVPLGFTPPASTIQCPAGKCVDHPSTIDLSRVLGSGTGNVALPAHSHVVATANAGKAEWWDVYVVGVKNLKSWNKIVNQKNYEEVKYLQKVVSSEVTPSIPTNLFLYFSVKK